MNHDFLVTLVCLAIIAILAGLLYAAGRAHMTAFTSIGELRSSLDKVHLENEKINRLSSSRGRFSTTPTSVSAL